MFGIINTNCTCVHALTHLCLTLHNHMDCSLSGSSVQGVFPGKNIGVGRHFFLQGISLIQGLNPCLLWLLHWQVVSLPLSHQGGP